MSTGLIHVVCRTADFCETISQRRPLSRVRVRAAEPLFDGRVAVGGLFFQTVEHVGTELVLQRLCGVGHTTQAVN